MRSMKPGEITHCNFIFSHFCLPAAGKGMKTNTNVRYFCRSRLLFHGLPLTNFDLYGILKLTSLILSSLVQGSSGCKSLILPVYTKERVVPDCMPYITPA